MTATSLAYFSSLHQAAVILKSIPKPQAAKILSRLQPRDMQQVIEAVNELDNITADQICELLEKLEQDPRFQRPPAPSPGIHETFRSCDHQQAVVGGDHPFAFLIQASPTFRRALLRDEHPKILATIIASLPTKMANLFVDELEPVVRASVLHRLSESKTFEAQEARTIRSQLLLKFQRLSTRSGSTDISDKTAAFCMTELLNLTDQQIKGLLKQVDTSHWAPALQGSSVNVQLKLFSNMALKPAAILRREIATLTNLDAQTIQNSIQQIGSKVRQLPGN